MPKYAGVMLVLALSTASEVEGQVIRGTVIDDESRASVAGAEVELLTQREQERTRATTDSMGVFVLAAPRAGAYGLRVTHVSYASYEAAGVAIGATETVSLEIRLGQTAIPLEALRVTARRQTRITGFDERRQGAGFGRFLTREEIDSRGAGRTTDLLRSMPGVTVTPVRRRGRGEPTGSMVTMRGACQPAIWLDGVPVAQYPESTLDDFLVPEVLEGVEVYPTAAGAPARFVTGPCGVILLWTRQGDDVNGQPWQWKRVLLGLGSAAALFLLIR